MSALKLSATASIYVSLSYHHNQTPLIPMDPKQNHPRTPPQLSIWMVGEGTAATTSIFIAAAVTDWLDGYIARKMKLKSSFGAFLDPVADKLMVAATLVLLCTRPLDVAGFGQAPWLLTLPSIAIIGREITMSAVREWAASKDSKLLEAVAVNNLGEVENSHPDDSINHPPCDPGLEIGTCMAMDEIVAWHNSVGLRTIAERGWRRGRSSGGERERKGSKSRGEKKWGKKRAMVVVRYWVENVILWCRCWWRHNSSYGEYWRGGKIRQSEQRKMGHRRKERIKVKTN
ncbi:CDP-alcohol phosphatidyltransferase [Sesbania bispinosa]|nr:CDP-alcohol phosphatidyltransferase [Sesbania bispinosa]